jgi:hypothetical protein
MNHRHRARDADGPPDGGASRERRRRRTRGFRTSDAEVDGGRVLCVRRAGHRVSWPPNLDDTWHTLTALFID